MRKGMSRHLFVGTLAVGTLLIGALAFAAIVSGDFRTSASTQVTTTYLQVNKPATVTGDLMLASIAIKGGSSATISSVPAGWTQIAWTNNDVNIALVSYWKIAGNAEPSSYTWVIDGQTTAEGGIVAYSGINATSPTDVFQGNSGFSAVATTGPITTTQANDQIVTLLAIDEGKAVNASNYFSTPVGTTEKFDVSNTPFGPSTALDEMTQVSAGTVGSKSATISGGNKPRNWVTQQIALRPFVPSTLSSAVAYWKLDGNSIDAVGTNNGTDFNVAYSASSGKINQGASFNGSSSRIDLGHVLTGTVNVSIAAWIKTSNSTFDSYIWSQRQGPNPQPAEAAFYISNGRLRFLSEGGAGGVDRNTDSWIPSNTIVADGNWHLVGVSQNGNTYTYYVDGVADGSWTSGNPVTYDGSLESAIGYDRLDLFYLSNGHFFSGSMDEVGVWNTTLSEADFAALYNAGAGRQYPF